jgi:AraC-like DNA-binding protein
MSQKRHDAAFDQVGNQGAAVIARMQDFPAGFTVRSHFHERDQLVYACRGVMTVRTDDGTWVVPTYRAVWVPAGVPHIVMMSGSVAMRSLYVRRRMFQSMPRGCCVVNVSPLLKELIICACGVAALNKSVRRHRHLISILADQLQASRTEALHLPNPTDPRARRIARILLSTPGDRRPLKLLCRRVGASKRTIERLFIEDVGMTCGKWRQHLRLMQAMRLLAEGHKVTHAALESGYSTPSAFISMFRKTLGTTPKQYLGSDIQHIEELSS